MKTLTLLIAVALVGCNPNSNVRKQTDCYTIDEMDGKITIRRLSYEGKQFYISRSYQGYWILGPEITKQEP